MAAPRRSKRIQTLHQAEEGSRRITESPEALNKDHPGKRRKTAGSQSGMLEGRAPKQHSDGDAPRDLAPKEDTPAIVPAVRRTKYIKADLRKQWEKKRKEEVEERSRKRTECKEYLHRMLALDRHDDEVLRYWKDLSRSIGSLVYDMDLRGITWDSLDEAVQQKFISFTPNVEELFDVYGMPPCVFQRWVWEIIDENFFSKKSKDIVWTSPYWETQAAMERYLQGTKLEMNEILQLLTALTLRRIEHNFPYANGIASYKYPHWRHATMEFYMALEDSPKKRRRIDPTCVVPILSKALGRYFPKERYCKRPMMLKHLEDELVAAEFYFDANLTFFSTVFHHPTTHQICGFPYEPELEGIEGQAMDEIEDDGREEKLVDFVAEPMLQCRGFHDGYDYHVKTAESPMKMTRVVREQEDEERDKETDEETDEERDEDKKYREDQEDKETDGSKRVNKEEEEEEEEEEESVRELIENKGKEVEVLTKEEKSREELEKEEDNKDEDNQAITKEGEENNKTKERGDKEGL
ncbi:hypothetical protein FPCIR_6550 [Fusarium pseudocircinatum]|uniref:Uncharacterized protein n=1 Tax=Fusarium pseudocircinatum TaxID=56676 RepID=A0A8H5LE48_9HYPO|nr:hypothetical protein FPCIR_6550 [Fusarium pseudocircinatum]